MGYTDCGYKYDGGYGYGCDYWAHGLLLQIGCGMISNVISCLTIQLDGVRLLLNGVHLCGFYAMFHNRGEVASVDMSVPVSIFHYTHFRHGIQTTLFCS